MPKANSSAQTDLKTPNAENRYEVTQVDLPLRCPLPGSSLWDSHPRVFVPLNDEGEGKCPYCGAEYHLQD
ncbi:MAG: zinc-finger domain-containing protein [Gammaproteobacteria bacterium]|nr:zinc-finger domain-containing protein [Gammaproteobacteria bacterium]